MNSTLRESLHDLGQVNGRAYVNGALNYLEAFLGVARPTSLPVSLDIVLTKACNLRCMFCISYGSLQRDRWMSFNLYQKIAGQLFPTAHNVSFCSGGEPFLYPLIREALSLARKCRTRTIVVSNGMLIKKSIARWIVDDQSLHELEISFDGSTKRTLERIRCGASYDTILNNVEYLDHYKRQRGAVYPRLAIRYAIMKSNAEEMPDVLTICARYNIKKLDVIYVNTSNDMDFDESLYNHPKLAARVFAEARRRAKELGIRVNMPRLPGQDDSRHRCPKPWHFCQIDTDGSIRFCYKAWRQRIGYVDGGFEAVWHGRPYGNIRKTVNSNSPYFPYCQYCSVRRGFSRQSSHNQRLHEDAYVIPDLDHLQIPFNERLDENLHTFRQQTPGL